MKRKTKSLWRESMRIGLPELDEARRNVVELLELLELRPLHSIASEAFISRFSVVQAAVEQFIEHEERLLREHPLPAESRRAHIANHERIQTLLHRIRSDSIKQKNQTALDVYQSLRAEIEKHVTTFRMDLGDHILPSGTAKRAEKGAARAADIQASDRPGAAFS